MTILPDLFKDPARSAKPRDTGITHVMDKGMSLAEVGNLMEVAEEYVDIVKLGWCTSVVVGNLEKKLNSSSLSRCGSAAAAACSSSPSRTERSKS